MKPIHYLLVAMVYSIVIAVVVIIHIDLMIEEHEMEYHNRYNESMVQDTVSVN